MLPPAVEEAIDGIAADRTSGASRLARLALETMGLAALEAHGRPDPGVLKEAAARISKAQPAMAIVHNVAHLFARLVSEGLEPLAVLAEIRTELDSARERIGRTFLKVAPDRATVVTLSHSENVLEALRAAHAKGRVEHVVVLESEPGLEGRTLAAALGEAGIRTTVIPDASGPASVADATYAILGADSVLRDGSAVNKIGSQDLARAASQHAKPVYVVCETLKFDARHDTSSWAALAGRNEDAMRRLFEVVPGPLITTFVTERGTYAPDIVRMMLAQSTAKS